MMLSFSQQEIAKMLVKRAAKLLGVPRGVEADVTFVHKADGSLDAVRVDFKEPAEAAS
jgi:hypothetical protein